MVPIKPRTAERAAAILSIAAGAIHGIVAPAHLEEWWGYGLFFLAAAAFQVLFGLALLTRAINPRDFGSRAQQAQFVLLLLGVGVNVAILTLYVVTRTSGIPLFGPEAGEVEEFGFLDIVAGILEIGVIVFLLRMIIGFRSLQADAVDRSG